MGFSLCSRRSASSLAFVCGRVARAQAVSVILNRSSLVPKPSLLRSFVSRGFPYSTSVTERLRSNQTRLTPRSTILSKLMITMCMRMRQQPLVTFLSKWKIILDENEDNMDVDEDADCRHDKANESSIPLVVSFTKKNGLSLEFSYTALPDEVVIDGLSVTRPENVFDDGTNLKGTFNPM